MNKVLFQRLGKIVPGKQKSALNGSDSIDERPIVLWRGSVPAALLYYRVHTHAPGVSWEERIERFDELPGESWIGRHRGPFPLVFGSSWSLTDKPIDEADSFDMKQIVTADVNGDGVDELILPRANGAIGVYSIDKQLFGQYALTAPKGMRYHVQNSFTAKLKARDVVLFLLQLEENRHEKEKDEAPKSKADPFAIVRVDQRGISRVPMPHTSNPISMFRELGAISRPGSTDLDEILTLFMVDDTPPKIYLSRQRPDGSAIEPLKEAYIDISPMTSKFLFLPDTSHAIVADDYNGHLYFIRPDKAANWIADLDLSSLAAPHGSVQILYPFDPGPEPKVMVAIDSEGDAQPYDKALYALNREGNCLRPGTAKNTWQPLARPEPLLRLTSPSKDHRFKGLLPQPGTENLLAVYSREAKMKSLDEEEIMTAAERFLQPAVVAERRRKFLEFGIEELEEVPNCADEERVKRSVTEKITTVEQWQHLLPDSYQDVLNFKKGQLLVRLETKLDSGFDYSFDPATYRNIDEYKIWLNAIKLGPETIFQVVHRGELAEGFSVPGYMPSQLEQTTVGLPFDFRAAPVGTSVVLPADIDPSPKHDKQPLGFFLATFPRKTF